MLIITEADTELIPAFNDEPGQAAGFEQGGFPGFICLYLDFLKGFSVRAGYLRRVRG